MKLLLRGERRGVKCRQFNWAIRQSRVKDFRHKNRIRLQPNLAITLRKLNACRIHGNACITHALSRSQRKQQHRFIREHPPDLMAQTAGVTAPPTLLDVGRRRRLPSYASRVERALAPRIVAVTLDGGPVAARFSLARAKPTEPCAQGEGGRAHATTHPCVRSVSRETEIMLSVLTKTRAPSGSLCA